MMPREKLAKYGAATLTDLELLLLVIGSGNKQVSARAIATQILKLLKEKGGEVTYRDRAGVKGMGVAKTSEMIALFELGRRYLIPADKPVITSTDDAVEQLKDLRSKRQECFAVLTLDGANRLISNEIVFQGTLDRSIIHPREIFARAIEDRAASIIVAHNHPSGNPRPSEKDIAVTKRIREAGELLGIKVLEHIIVTQNEQWSI